jgi:uncharacterized protein (DUF58 family)
MQKIKKLYENLFFTRRFFLVMLGLATMFVVSFAFEAIYGMVWFLFFCFLGFTLLELLFLFLSKNKIQVKRILPEKLSNGDENDIYLNVRNPFSLKIYAQVIDELPNQFQSRDFLHQSELKPKSDTTLQYRVRPQVRGVYEFGVVHVFASTLLGLVQRRYNSAEVQTVKCYPAFLTLRNMDIRAVANEQIIMGSRKIRRIGSTMEFEQIKEYVIGDDIRTINWKSTAKRGQLMVNQFQDEKSQDIYVAIDTGRTMEMPFNGLSLLDYSINASLMMLSLALAKYDRSGMFSFGKRMDNVVLADKRPNQMQQIMEGLYAVETKFEESNFAALYAQLKRRIAHRSLIVLFTNFESMDGMQRNLPYLTGINKQHLLLVVFFKNKEIASIANANVTNTTQLSESIIAGKLEYDKRLMVRELSQYGILSLLTTPEELNIAVMNKYLEIKGKGMI